MLYDYLIHCQEQRFFELENIHIGPSNYVDYFVDDR